MFYEFIHNENFLHQTNIFTPCSELIKHHGRIKTNLRGLLQMFKITLAS